MGWNSNADGLGLTKKERSEATKRGKEKKVKKKIKKNFVLCSVACVRKMGKNWKNWRVKEQIGRLGGFGFMHKAEWQEAVMGQG